MRKRTKELSDSPSSLEVFQNLCQRLHDATRTKNPASTVEVAGLWQSIMEHEYLPNLVMRLQMAIRKQQHPDGQYGRRLKTVLKNLTAPPELLFKNPATTSYIIEYYSRYVGVPQIKTHMEWMRRYDKAEAAGVPDNEYPYIDNNGRLTEVVTDANGEKWRKEVEI